ncbi:MAG: GNAT family N-acetyltransferase [Acidimicrobiales bacterium]|nr:GNAT family N-acetyltransferase [Acidimicrobiales bacterium]
MIRDFTESDAEAVMALNAANVPEVGPMDRDRLDHLIAESFLFAVIELDGAVEGVLVVMVDGGAYRSPNYRWFSDRHPEFIYVDRIMLSPATRGRGFGDRLYERVAAAGRAAGKPVMCAEVNTVPPNPRSSRFHERFGFVEVGRQRPYGTEEEVALLELPL